MRAEESEAAMSGAQRREVPRWEALDLLRSTTIGRICIVDHGCPIALPMNFRVTGDTHDFRIVLRAARGTAVGGYVGPASLEVDQIRLDRGPRGASSCAASSARRRRRMRCPTLARCCPDRHEWLLLEPVAISGRRFSFDGSQDGFFVDWGVAPA